MSGTSSPVPRPGPVTGSVTRCLAPRTGTSWCPSRGGAYAHRQHAHQLGAGGDPHLLEQPGQGVPHRVHGDAQSAARSPGSSAPSGGGRRSPAPGASARRLQWAVHELRAGPDPSLVEDPREEVAHRRHRPARRERDLRVGVAEPHVLHDVRLSRGQRPHRRRPRARRRPLRPRGSASGAVSGASRRPWLRTPPIPLDREHRPVRPKRSRSTRRGARLGERHRPGAGPPPVPAGGNTTRNSPNGGTASHRRDRTAARATAARARGAELRLARSRQREPRELRRRSCPPRADAARPSWEPEHGRPHGVLPPGAISRLVARPTSSDRVDTPAFR